VLLPARSGSQEATWALLSSEWIDPPTAVQMGMAWRVVPDDDLRAEVASAAATLAALDPAPVAAAKRLLNEGRADVVAAAIDREQATITELLRGRRRR
jgi:enoyl-CoA hydratase/carnithine racemase